MSAEIRELNRARAHSQLYPDIHYYLAEEKMFVYYRLEREPRIIFKRTNNYYTVKGRTKQPSIREAVIWAVRQPEFAGLTILPAANTVKSFY